MTHARRDARVIVIGGGFSGVAAAARLRDHGARVMLLESRPVLGGRARSDRFGGVTIDVGAQLIASSFTRTRALLARSDASLAPSAGRDLLVRDGRREAIHFGSMRSLLTFSGLSAGEKLRLGGTLLPLLVRHRAHFDALAEKMPSSLDEQSARAYVETHVGSRAADVLAEPPINSFYAASGAEVSLGFLLALGHYGSESDMIAARDGWSDALARAVRDIDRVHDVTVDGLAVRGDGGVAVSAGDRRWEADGVVVATGARSAHALLRHLRAVPEPLVEWLASLDVRRTVTLAVGVDRALDRQAFGIFADPASARAVAAAAVHGAKTLDADHLVDDVVLAWPTPRAARRLSELPADAVVSEMLPELEQLVPELAGRVTRARVYRFAEGTPLPAPGHAASVRSARTLLERIGAPLALAGDYLAQPIVEGAVASGERAADRLLDVLGREPLAGERSTHHI